MEPRIQYAKTKDGVSIAFWTLGKGIPQVGMPNVPFHHVQLSFQLPSVSPWYDRLTQKRRLIRYDPRGAGLSDRDVTDYSLDAQMLDLESVVDRLGLETFVLFGEMNSGPVAISYAAHHPERVSHLILWCAFARGSDQYQSSKTRAIRALRGTDWDVYVETLARLGAGESGGEEELAAFLRDCVTPESAWRAMNAVTDFDANGLLSQITAPTLVLHRRQAAFPVVDLAKNLASEIPDARLALLEGTSVLAHMGDMESVAQAIDDFLGETEDKAVAVAPNAADVHTILFTDMESSTALTRRLGDAKAQELVRAHNAIVRDALNNHGGSEIKHTGDGIMASFPSASAALECAVAIQQGVAAQPEMPLGVRIGLNAGEPVAEEDDLFGAYVQLARRVCDRAEPGQIVASNVVRELATGKGFLFSDLGDVVPKGFEEPVRLYEVRWREYT